MYRKILLAYDGSVAGRMVLREGAILARKCDAQIYLLSVVTGAAGIGIAGGVQPGALIEDQAQDFVAVLREGEHRLKKLGLYPVTRLVRGEPALEIGKFAKEISADLIVVGHSRQSLLARWWAGSKGDYILDNITCSLLIARKTISDDEFLAEFHR